MIANVETAISSYLGYIISVGPTGFFVLAPNGDAASFVGMPTVRQWVRTHRRRQREAL